MRLYMPASDVRWSYSGHIIFHHSLRRLWTRRAAAESKECVRVISTNSSTRESEFSEPNSFHDFLSGLKGMDTMFAARGDTSSVRMDLDKMFLLKTSKLLNRGVRRILERVILLKIVDVEKSRSGPSSHKSTPSRGLCSPAGAFHRRPHGEQLDAIIAWIVHTM